ncbi:MAG: M50 family metallopeptidase [Akkermansiaceae bacterium]|nr:M50 family metallopeptidase [Akkermansiaceae bacterium]
MFRFNVFGIPVEVQPWFWITLALIGGGMSATSGDLILALGLFMIAGFLSILVHELGHALTGKAFGAPTAITLEAFGGYATFPGNAFSRPQDFLVTAAGPIAQSLLGLAFLALDLFVALPNSAVRTFVTNVWVISFFWAVINLIPVLPLDGGRLLDAILGPKRRKITLWVSVVCAVVAAALMFWRTHSIIFPIFLGFMAYQNWQALKFRR